VKVLFNNAQILDPAPFLNAIHGRDVLFATHGFNVTEANGEVNLDDLAPLLTLGPGALLVGVLWPGDADWGALSGAVYPFVGKTSMDAGTMLANYINANCRQAKSVSFASHSLGARVMLQTVRCLDRRARRLILLAGAIDDDCLTGEYAGAAANVDRISVLASMEDKILGRFFPAGNFLSGIITRGHPYWHAAIGHNGPAQPIPGKLDPRAMIPDDWMFNHGSYLPDGPVALPPGCAIPSLLPAPGQPVPCGQTAETAPWKRAWTAAMLSDRFR